MEALCDAAERMILGGYEIIILSDRRAGRELAPIPALLACAGVHHHLIRRGLRQRCGLVIGSRHRSIAAQLSDVMVIGQHAPRREGPMTNTDTTTDAGTAAAGAVDKGAV